MVILIRRKNGQIGLVEMAEPARLRVRQLGMRSIW